MRKDNIRVWHSNERYIHIRVMVAELKESWTGNQKTADFLLLTAITTPPGITVSVYCAFTMCRVL